MKKFLSVVVLVSVTSVTLATQIISTKEPVNIATVKKSLVNYHDSGNYAAGLDKVAGQALSYLKKRVAENAKAAHPKKLAIVLDIDETSLSNYPDMIKSCFGGTPKSLDAAMNQGHDPVIKQTQQVYDYAIKHHVSVFFITGRNEYMRASTVRNLHQAGYKKWQELYLRQPEQNSWKAEDFKTPIRRTLSKEGYDIVLNMGDQKSDLIGGYADKAFKLPNPYYYIA